MCCAAIRDGLYWVTEWLAYYENRYNNVDADHQTYLRIFDDGSGSIRSDGKIARAAGRPRASFCSSGVYAAELTQYWHDANHKIRMSAGIKLVFKLLSRWLVTLGDNSLLILKSDGNIVILLPNDSVHSAYHNWNELLHKIEEDLAKKE